MEPEIEKLEEIVLQLRCGEVLNLDEAADLLDDAIGEIERTRKIESAAKEMFRVKGRFNTQTATCLLGDLLGEKVHWPEKNLQCIEVATLKPYNAKLTGSGTESG